MVMEGLGSKRGGPKIKTRLVDPVESLRQEVRGRVGQGTKVDQKSSGELNRLEEILSNGHCVTSARDNI